MIFEGMVEAQKIANGSVSLNKGAISSFTPDATHRVVTMHVSRLYLGDAKDKVTILTGIGNGDCGVDFQTGKAYLVYADIISGYVFTSICTGTAPLEQAGAALRFLRHEPPADDDLLDPQSYYRKYLPEWTGTVCGKVITPDGTPLGDANVEMSQLREEFLPSKTVSDPNLSKVDGSFCIKDIFPGKYLLAAQSYDYDDSIRWTGYYTGVTKDGEAMPIEVSAGLNQSGLELHVQEQPLYKARIRIVTSDGSPVPWKGLGITIDSTDRRSVGYHESHGADEDGSYTFGLIPLGHYMVRTIIEAQEKKDRVSLASKWQMVEQEIDLRGNREIVLRLTPLKR
jgi:hypothetical protein